MGVDFKNTANDKPSNGRIWTKTRENDSLHVTCETKITIWMLYCEYLIYRYFSPKMSVPYKQLRLNTTLVSSTQAIWILLTDRFPKNLNFKLEKTFLWSHFSDILRALANELSNLVGKGVMFRMVCRIVAVRHKLQGPSSRMHFDCDCSCFAQVLDEFPKTYTLTKKTLLIWTVCCFLMFDSYQLQSLRSRYENATPNLCWVFCALLGDLCN